MSKNSGLDVIQECLSELLTLHYVMFVFCVAVFTNILLAALYYIKSVGHNLHNHLGIVQCLVLRTYEIIYSQIQVMFLSTSYQQGLFT